MKDHFKPVFAAWFACTRLVKVTVGSDGLLESAVVQGQEPADPNPLAPDKPRA